MNHDQSQSAWKTWWDNEGSAMRPLPTEDTEQFARRITEIAWSNGAYCALEIAIKASGWDCYRKNDKGEVTA